MIHGPDLAARAAGARARGRSQPTVPHAIVLGLVQGPTELMPISSSAHLTLLPRLAGWEWEGVDAERRKGLEVALHAGTALALAWRLAAEPPEGPGEQRRLALAALLASLPAALAGLLGERFVERSLGGFGATAAGLAAGSAAMLLAERRSGSREARSVGAADALWLGTAQAAALWPGVSRSGAVISVARLRRFSPQAAERLSDLVALPVIAGAVALKGARLVAVSRREDVSVVPYAAGASAALASTVAAAALRGRAGTPRALWPFAAYRLALAGIALVGGARPPRALESIAG